jgi:methyl-accepting chemotaxis protein
MKNEKLLIAIISLVSIVVVLAGVGILLDRISNARINKRIESIETIAGKLEENQQRLEETARTISETTAGIDVISAGIAEQNKRIEQFYKSVGNSTSSIEAGLGQSGQSIDRIETILQDAKERNNN